MIEFRQILCPIDFSETSLHALKYAEALARWYGGRLEVLHVVPVFEDTVARRLAAGGDFGPVPSTPSRDEVTAQIRRAIEETGEGPVQAEPLGAEGSVHTTILARAAVGPANLVVLGTHGHSGFSRLVLGSTTEKIVRTAPCPVLTVPPGAPAEAREPASLKRILCAVDFSPASIAALKYAVDLARQANGQVTALHAVEYMDPEEPCDHVDPALRRVRQRVIDDARDRLHALLADEPTSWCEIEEVVAVNRAYREILQRAADDRTDLIVMGAQGRGGAELMLYGSNTQHVVRAAPCPVLTVRS